MSLQSAGGSAFELFFWRRVLTCVTNSNDCFAFSLVCKLFAHIFSEQANDKKAQFGVSITDWVKPKTVHPKFRLFYETKILPDGTLHGGRHNMGHDKYSYSHIVGYVIVTFVQDETMWSSVVSNWKVRFKMCRVCNKRHAFKVPLIYAFPDVHIRGSIRCAVVKYARYLKLRMHVEEE